ncbi:general secretion pathway protein GspG [Planctomycetales bacterium]|nr:general secretion pathway protein GspG [Planctomycetales bacterium]
MIALHNYHDVRGAFPAMRAYLHNSTDGDRLPPMVVLSPFYERQDVLDKVISDRDKVAAGSSPWSSVTTLAQYGNGWRSFADQKVNVLCCPSDPSYGTYSWEGNYSRCNIVHSVGDVVQRNEYYAASATTAVYLGAQKRGAFAPFLWKDLAAFTDGSSNTVMISETVSSTSRGDDNTVASGIATNASTINWSKPSDCLKKRSSTDPKLLSCGETGSGCDHVASFRGARIYLGLIQCVGFCAILPPNSPNCSPNTEGAGYSIVSTSSMHSGGVNTGFGDGSVHFVSDTINTGNLDSNSNGDVNVGSSPFGIWGAYGSVNGGESVAL